MTRVLITTAAMLSLALVATPGQATTILIDGTGPDYLLNGSFESFTDVDGNDVPDDWVGTVFTNPSITGPGTTEYGAQSNGNQANEGSRSAVVGVSANNDVGRAPGADVGHTIQTGDVFTLSFDYRGTNSWQAGDELDWELFYTDNGDINGVRTAVASGAVLPEVGVYNSTGSLVSTPADLSAAGNALFIAFTPGAGTGDDGTGAVDNDFARIDQVNLSVVAAIPEPTSLGLAAGLTVLLMRRRKA